MSARLPASFKPGRGQTAVFRAQTDGVCVGCRQRITAGHDYVAVHEQARGGLGLQTKRDYVHALPCAQTVGIEIPVAAVEAGIPAAGSAPASQVEVPRLRTPGRFRFQQGEGELRSMVAQRAGTCPVCTSPVQAGTDVICLWPTPPVEVSPTGRSVWIHARCAFDYGLPVPADVKSYLGNQGAINDGGTLRSRRKSTYRRGAGPGSLGNLKY